MNLFNNKPTKSSIAILAVLFLIAGFPSYSRAEIVNVGEAKTAAPQKEVAAGEAKLEAEGIKGEGKPAGPDTTEIGGTKVVLTAVKPGAKDGEKAGTAKMGIEEQQKRTQRKADEASVVRNKNAAKRVSDALDALIKNGGLPEVDPADGGIVSLKAQFRSKLVAAKAKADQIIKDMEALETRLKDETNPLNPIVTLAPNERKKYSDKASYLDAFFTRFMPVVKAHVTQLNALEKLKKDYDIAKFDPANPVDLIEEKLKALSGKIDNDLLTVLLNELNPNPDPFESKFDKLSADQVPQEDYADLMANTNGIGKKQQKNNLMIKGTTEAIKMLKSMPALIPQIRQSVQLALAGGGLTPYLPYGFGNENFHPLLGIPNAVGAVQVGIPVIQNNPAQYLGLSQQALASLIDSINQQTIEAARRGSVAMVKTSKNTLSILFAAAEVLKSWQNNMPVPSAGQIANVIDFLRLWQWKFKADFNALRYGINIAPVNPIF